MEINRKLIILIFITFVIFITKNNVYAQKTNIICKNQQLGDSLYLYFPMSIGNEWVYYYEEPGIEDTIPSVFYRIIDTLSINKKPYFVFEVDSTYHEYYYSDSLGHVFRYIDGNEILWFDFNIALKDTYQIDIPSLNLYYNVTLFGKNEIVQNRAGRFENCLWFLFDNPHQSDDAFELYFAKNVGIVERFLPHAIGLQLYSAKVDGKIYPDTLLSVKPIINNMHPEQFFLVQNYPNPFYEKTVISLKWNSKQYNGTFLIIIYNLLGKEVRRFNVKNNFTKFIKIQWDGKDQYGRELAEGVYIYRVGSNDKWFAVGKITYLKGF